MASRGDIQAGRAFVTLYVRDHAFKRQLAENESLYEEFLQTSVMPDLDAMDEAIDAYDVLASVGSDTLEDILDTTMDLTDETERLLDVLEEVMDTYHGLSDMQRDGITLNAGGGQGGMMPYQGTAGFSFKDMGVKIGEGFESIPMKALKGVGLKLGMAAFHSEAVQRRLEERGQRGGMIGGIAKQLRIGSKRMEADQHGTVDGQVLSSTIVPAANEAADALTELADAARSAEEPVTAELVPPVMAELAQPTEAPVMAELARSGEEPVTAELAKDANEAANALTGLADAARSAEEPVTAESVPPPVMAELARSAESPVMAELAQPAEEPVMAGLAGSGESPVMAELAKDAKEAEVVMAELASSTAKTDIVMAELANNTVETKQGMGLMAKAAGVARFSIVALVKVLLPLLAVLAAAYVAMKAFRLATTAIKLPFQIVGRAIKGAVALIRSIPGAIKGAVEYLKRLGKAATDAAKRLTAAAWAGFTGTINRISSSFKQLGRTVAIVGAGMAAAGALIVAPLTRAAKEFQKHGERINLLTEQYRRFGVTAETMSVYAYAASQAVGRLGAMGESERIANIMRTVKEGTPEFENWRRQAEAAGAVMSGQGVSAAMALGNAYRRLSASLSGLWQQLGAAVAPAIAESTELMVGAIRGVTAWVKQNQSLIATVFRVATAVAGLGTALATVGGALMGIGTAISPLTAILAAVAGAMAVVEYRTQVGTTLIGAYRDSVVRMYQTVMQYLEPILKHFQRVFGGVKDAVMAGDLQLAFQIAIAGIKVAWVEGMNWLAEQTGGIFGNILKNLAGGNWKGAAEQAMNGIRVAWLSGVNFLDRLWTDLRANFRNVMYGLADQLDPIWQRIKDGFTGIRDWGRGAIDELGAYVAGLAAAFDQIRSRLSLVLKGLAVLNPAVALAFAGTVAAMEKIQGGASEAYRGAVLDARIASGNLRRAAKSDEEHVDLQQRSQERRQQQAVTDKKEEEQVMARIRDREREIQGLQEQGTPEADAAVTAAKEELKEARKELDELLEKAEKRREEMAQPDAIEKASSTSAAVTSSAYAFGQFSGASPEIKAMEKAERQRKRAQKTLDKIAKNTEHFGREPKRQEIFQMDGAS